MTMPIESESAARAAKKKLGEGSRGHTFAPETTTRLKAFMAARHSTIILRYLALAVWLASCGTLPVGIEPTATPDTDAGSPISPVNRASPDPTPIPHNVPATTIATPELTFVRYSSETAGFAVDYPAGWQVTVQSCMEPERTACTAIRLQSDWHAYDSQSFARYAFIVERLPTTANTISEAVESGLRPIVFPFRDQITQSPTTIGGEMAVQLTALPDGTRQIWVLHSGQEYRLILSPDEGLDGPPGSSVLYAFQAFQRTLTFLPATADVPLPTTIAPPSTPSTTTEDCQFAWFFSSQPQQGCPREPPLQSYAVAQSFERGTMIWVHQLSRYFILSKAILFEGDVRKRLDYIHDPLDIIRDTSGEVIPPAGLYAPESGFGLVWRGDVSQSAGYREVLGWALAPEFGYDTMHQCDDARPSGGRNWNFCYLRGPGGEVIVLHPLGGWYRLGERQAF